MIRKLLTYIIFCLLTAGCSDDMDPVFRSQIDNDGNITVRFAVPSIATVATRAGGDVDENAVKTIRMIIADGETVVVNEVFRENVEENALVTNAEGKYEINYRLDKNYVSKLKDLDFYFLANYDFPENSSEMDGLTTLDIENLSTQELICENHMVMSGKWKYSDNTSDEVSLIRNAAKISIGTEDQNQNYSVDYDNYPFSVYGTAGSCLLFSGAENHCGEPSEPGNFNQAPTVGQKYVNPTINSGNDNAGKVFVVVKTAFNGKDYFYRIDFKKKEGDDGGATEKYFDIKPNHWYQIVIKDILGAGYASAEEASKNPTSLLVYDIFDYAPAVYNMISDGIRELGVSHEISCSDDNAQPLTQLYVKLYSPYPEEISLENVDISCEDSWVEIRKDQARAVSDAGLAGNSSTEEDDTPGTLYEVPVAFTGNSIGEMKTELTVSWKGLTRIVPVVWESVVKASDICSAKLKIFKNGESLFDDDNYDGYTVSDYWNFISPFENYNDSKALHGILPEENNGKDRDDGLHFPVMYGSVKTKEWKYEYELDFSGSLGDDFSGKDVDFTYRVSGNTFLRNNVSVKKIDGKSAAFTVGFTGPDAYDYATGILTLNLKTSDGSASKTYSLPLYHTGFFHKVESNEENQRKDSHNLYSVGDYLYYEVVPIPGPDGMRFWLDRNLGATSAGMNVAPPSTHPGMDDKAGGGYYKVADYTKFKSPTMKTNVCPPGYEVPSEQLWDGIRSSVNFVTTFNPGGYYNSYYNVNTEIGKVYFPKMKYTTAYDADGYTGSSSLLGDEEAGYYWTKTEASGLEKEHIGNWLKVFAIFGNAAYFTRGKLTYEGDMHAMSVRCVNVDKNESSELSSRNRISFLLRGTVTHVYLYTLDERNNKVALTAWPGKQIADYSTAQNGNKINFYYNSNIQDLTNVYVIFNYMDKDGIIRTMSKPSGDSSPDAAAVSSSASLKNIEGWPIIESDGESPDKYEWECCLYDDFVKKTRASSSPGTWYGYRIYWRKNLSGNEKEDYQRILYNYDNNGVINNVRYTDVEGDYYYYDFNDSDKINPDYYRRWCFSTSEENANIYWYCIGGKYIDWNDKHDWWWTEESISFSEKMDPVKGLIKYYEIDPFASEPSEPTDYTLRIYWKRYLNKKYILYNTYGDERIYPENIGVEDTYYYYDLKVVENTNYYWVFVSERRNPYPGDDNSSDWYGANCNGADGLWWSSNGAGGIRILPENDPNKPYQKYVKIDGRTQ